jgi:hypothetical protein
MGESSWRIYEVGVISAKFPLDSKDCDPQTESQRGPGVPRSTSGHRIHHPCGFHFMFKN